MEGGVILSMPRAVRRLSSVILSMSRAVRSLLRLQECGARVIPYSRRICSEAVPLLYKMLWYAASGYTIPQK